MLTDLTICCIIKNEASQLPRFLKAVKKHGLLEQLLVVDTGSTDDSPKILQKYGITPEHFDWTDDFSAARNYAASLSKTDWILALDADEFIEEVDLKAIGKLLAGCDFVSGPEPLLPPLGRVHRINETPKGIRNEWITRLYHRDFFQYEGRIHEQLTNKDNLRGKITRAELPLTILHTGYREGVVKEKALRDKQLLLQEIKDLTESNAIELDKLSYQYYQLARAHRLLEEQNEAKSAYENAFALLTDAALQNYDAPLTSWQRDMIDDYGYLLLELGETAEALSLERYYDKASERADYLLVLGLIYMQNGRLQDALMAFELASCTPYFAAEGANTYLPLYNMGVVYECSGDLPKARQAYKRCGDFDKAKERLCALSSSGKA